MVTLVVAEKISLQAKLDFDVFRWQTNSSGGNRIVEGRLFQAYHQKVKLFDMEIGVLFVLWNKRNPFGSK
jgi:hypothetical protein